MLFTIALKGDYLKCCYPSSQKWAALFYNLQSHLHALCHIMVEHTRTLLEHLQQEGKHEGALNFHPMWRNNMKIYYVVLNCNFTPAHRRIIHNCCMFDVENLNSIYNWLRKNNSNYSNTAETDKQNLLMHHWNQRSQLIYFSQGITNQIKLWPFP